MPFTSDDERRNLNVEWLLDYYSVWLPGAQIIRGVSHSVPFIKTEAVNQAFGLSSGDIVAIVDADCYVDPDTILQCAEKIRAAREANKALWYVPYRRFYRLSEAASNAILAQPTTDPVAVSDSLSPAALDSTQGISGGHWYGALIQVMPREAFQAANGMDPRFQGWGGEDISFMRAVDTLYGRHKTIDGPVYHLWHPATVDPRDRDLRMWDGQERQRNSALAGRYQDSAGDRARMQALVNEH